MSLNDEFLDTERPDGMCLLAFVVDDFSESFLHQSAFTIKESRSA